MPKNFSCNLGSINLSKFVKHAYRNSATIDWEDLSTAVRIGVKALDDIIDENYDRHALREQANNSRNYRNIGLGIMGYSNMLFKLGLTYGSEEAIAFTDKLFKFIFEEALWESLNLAKEKGMFPKCNPEAIAQSSILRNVDPNIPRLIREYGLRNCSLLSIAPNGSISTMLGCTGGCEPEFALSYTRRTDNLAASYEVYCQSVQEYFEELGQPIDMDKLPNYFITSKDIPWRNRVRVQGIMQKYIDTAISSTVNLPQSTTVEEIEQIYLEAWKYGLKGITIYRAGCAREGILVEEKPAEKVSPQQDEKVSCNSCSGCSDLPRGYVMDVSDDLIGYKRKLNTGCGSLHFEVYSDEMTGEPQETFINIGSSGGCERNYQFISRLISMALRGGIPIEAIIDQAMSIRPCKAYTDRTKKKGDTSPGTSCPSAFGHALKDLQAKMKDRCFADESTDEENDEEDLGVINTIETIVTPKCPECGAKLQFEGGCVICKGDETHPGCGWSKCD